MSTCVSPMLSKNWLLTTEQKNFISWSLGINKKKYKFMLIAIIYLLAKVQKILLLIINFLKSFDVLIWFADVIYICVLQFYFI